jgi:hypothetical protein
VVSEQVRYKAFLSYSSVDQPWAVRLHKGLESYRALKNWLVGRQQTSPFRGKSNAGSYGEFGFEAD